MSKAIRSGGKSSTLVIADGMNLAFKAFYAYSSLSHKGQSVAIIFGMPSILMPHIKRYGKKNVVVVWEGKKSPHRLGLHPEYKAHRKALDPELKEDLFKQIDIARSLLKVLGVKQVKSPTMEADDLIYRYAYKSKADNKVIISEDKDFLQLIKPGLKVIQTTKGRILHYKNFQRTFDLHPNQWVDYLSLIGDSSDNIPGVPGIGEKTAIALLQKFGSVDNFLSSKDDLPRVKKEKVRDPYEKAKTLIDLAIHYQLTENETHRILKLSDYSPIDKTQLKKICQTYSIKSFLTPSFLTAFQ